MLVLKTRNKVYRSCGNTSALNSIQIPQKRISRRTSTGRLLFVKPDYSSLLSRMLRTIYLLVFCVSGAVCFTEPIRGVELRVRTPAKVWHQKACKSSRLHPSSQPDRSPSQLSAAMSKESVSQLAKIVFKFEGNVPFVYSLGINGVLFAILRSKLLSALTPAGFMHALALGTMLWTTLGWRGWSYCVLYLVLGQVVTKIRFADKQKRNLAEGRGGRRGPENASTGALMRPPLM